MMNALISQRIPLANIKNSSPFRQTTPITNLSWRLQAEAKGFGKTSKQSIKKDITTTPNNNKDDDDDDDKIPQVVWDRMIVRILFYVGTPMAIGIGLLCIFNVIKEQNIIDFPAWVPFVTTLLAFGTSTLGIAYGTLSTSLDPDKKGSVLGWDEVQQNWPELWKEEDDRSR